MKFEDLTPDRFAHGRPVTFGTIATIRKVCQVFKTMNEGSRREFRWRGLRGWCRGHVGSLAATRNRVLRNVMKTALRLSYGLLLIVSAVGCHTCQHSCGDQGCTPQGGCQHKSCLGKLFKGKGGGGCQSDCGDGCGVGDGEMACDCGRHHGPRKSKSKCKHCNEAAMYGYDNSVVYTGDDWQGMPQPGMGMMPMAGGCSGCAGGAPMMSMPSTGCAGCGGSGMSPIPNEGGCASCGGSGVVPQPQPPTGGGCASCGGNHSAPVPAAPPAGGGCASCGAAAANESFYNPMGPHHHPAPAPPAEGGVPNPSIESVPGGDKGPTSGGETIQKIQWVPRQL